MSNRELLKQALAALEAMQMEAKSRWCGLRIADEAIDALRTALAQPAPKPVGEVRAKLDSYGGTFVLWTALLKPGTKLYATPPAQPAPAVHDGVPDTSLVICPNCCTQFRAIPQDVQRLMLDAGFEPPFVAAPAVREPLTDGQMTAIYRRVFGLVDSRPVGPQVDFIRAIEQAHGIGSTGGGNE